MRHGMRSESELEYKSYRRRLREMKDRTLSSEIECYAELYAKRELIAVLDVLQRRVDGWAREPAAGLESGTDACADMAVYVRGLIRDVGGEEARGLGG